MLFTRRHFLQSTLLIGGASKSLELYAAYFKGYKSVKDFGAKGDGVNDDTQAIQECVNSLGVVIFPEGEFLISDTIVQKFSGQKFIGAGVNPYNQKTQGATRLVQTNPTKSVFKSSGTGFSAESLNITYNKIPTAGCAFDIQHSGSFIEKIWIDKCWRGFAYSNNTGHMLSNCNVQSAYYCAFSVGSTNDVAVTNCIFVGADLNNKLLDQKNICPNGVVSFEQYVQAVQLYNVDILGGAKSVGVINTASSVANLNQIAAFCKFTNTYFDSSYYGADIDKCVGMTFVNCWFSSRPNDGAVVGANFCDNTKFIGCNFENCGGNGIKINRMAENTLVDSCSILNNSQSLVGKYNGIHIQSDCNYFTISNCIIQNSKYFPKTQNYGIVIESGNSKYFKITGNTFLNNISGDVSDMSNPSKQKIIRDNLPIAQ